MLHMFGFSRIRIKNKKLNKFLKAFESLSIPAADSQKSVLTLIGREWSCDLDTGLSLVDSQKSVLGQIFPTVIQS